MKDFHTDSAVNQLKQKHTIPLGKGEIPPPNLLLNFMWRGKHQKEKEQEKHKKWKQVSHIISTQKSKKKIIIPKKEHKMQANILV